MSNQIDKNGVALQVGEALKTADSALMTLLGIKLITIQPGEAIMQMRVREDMVNSQQLCHGGLLFTLADHSFAYACMSTNQAGVTQSAHLILSNPAHLHDILQSKATITLDSGKRTVTSDAIVTNQHGIVVAHFRGIHYRTKQNIVEIGLRKQ